MSNTKSDRIKVAGAVSDSIVDGPGLRYAFFVQGCSHHCPGCHNPESWDPDGGEWRSTEEIWAEIKKNPLLSGVTLSGGEPFEQAEALLPLARLVKENGLELGAYSGYTFEQLVDKGGAALELLGLCDVLVDGPYLEGERSLALWFKGSRNQRVLDVPQSLALGQPVPMRDGRWQPE